MLQTIVQRAPADRQGDDITEVLLTTIEAQVARGRSEINSVCSNRRLVDCNLTPTGFVRPTETVQITDMQLGPVWGVVDSYSLQISVNQSSLTVSTAIKYEREDVE